MITTSTASGTDVDRTQGCFDEVGIGKNFAWMAGVRHRVGYGSARRGRKLREAFVVRLPDDVDVIERVEIACEIAHAFASFQEIRQLDDAQVQLLDDRAISGSSLRP